MRGGDLNGQSVRVDAEALVRSPEITDAQEIARTKNDSWRVGYRGLLPDSILAGWTMRGPRHNMFSVGMDTRTPGYGPRSESQPDAARRGRR